MCTLYHKNVRKHCLQDFVSAPIPPQKGGTPPLWIFSYQQQFSFNQTKTFITIYSKGSCREKELVKETRSEKKER